MRSQLFLYRAGIFTKGFFFRLVSCFTLIISSLQWLFLLKQVDIFGGVGLHELTSLAIYVGTYLITLLLTL